MAALDWIAIIALVAAFGGLAVLLYNWSSYLGRRRLSFPSLREKVSVPVKSVFFFAISALTFLSAYWAGRQIAHHEVIKELDSVGANYYVSVNGTPYPDAKQILLTLRSLHWIPAHHSNPTKHITIEIFQNSGRLVLWLARDSANPREYWVFYPKYRITASNEIGRVVTSLFDEY